jgi:phosphohistidine phosphatase
MAPQLWLLRHAEAEPHGTRSDAERKLTARGKRQARTAGLALARMGADFEVVLVSPKERAQKTAEIASAEWSPAERERMRLHPPLAEGFDADQARRAVEEMGDDSGHLLLVGHEPDFSDIVRDLTGGLADLKKGGVAMLRLDAAAGELALLLRPRDLALIAGVPAEGS